MLTERCREMKKDYWTNFWINYSKKTKDKDPQTQVLRTFNKKPIDPQTWDFTLSYIKRMLDIQHSDTVLDLCAGNGLIAESISGNCKSVTAVDVSEELLHKIDKEKFKNIKTIVNDVKNVGFENNSFTKIIIYAGIQYLNYKETIILFELVYKWLRKDGIFFLGDIPDSDKIWSFFNNKEREEAYFESNKNEKPIVGTWYCKYFLVKLSEYCGFKESKVINQQRDMIYSHFRFDMCIKK